MLGAVDNTGLTITISVAHVVDRGVSVGCFAFTTYSGGNINPPPNPLFSVSRQTILPNGSKTDPRTTLDELKLEALEKSHQYAISHIHGLKDPTREN